VTQLALRFTAHMFQRPGEIRNAKWAEIDFGKAVWTIPPARMKQRQAHRVPLSKQPIAILNEAKALTGDGRFMLLKLGSPLKPMCENTINQAQRRMGFGKIDMTAHGFRAMASTLLNTSGKWSPDTIARAGAQGQGNHSHCLSPGRPLAAAGGHGAMLGGPSRCPPQGGRRWCQ
jgi:integrase